MLSIHSFAAGVFLFVLASTSIAFSESSKNGEISGFRYQACEANKCMVVEAPRAWLSTANGAFVAERTESNSAVFRILKDQKSVRAVSAIEIVLRPEIGMMTVETATDVLLVDLENFDVETVKK